MNWTNSATSEAWYICYKASVHAGTSETFHLRCDNKGKSITVVRTMSDHILGGVTFVPWSCRGSYVTDLNAFIFSLKSPSMPPFIAKIMSVRTNMAVYDHLAYFPTFGDFYGIRSDFRLQNLGSIIMNPTHYDYEEGLIYY